MSIIKRSGLAAVLLTAPFVAAMCATGTAGAAVERAQSGYAVGMTTETYIDTHRTTVAWGPSPALPTRTLVTTILYPTQGSPSSGTPQTGATADRQGGPYPLIVFAHAFGAIPQDYLPLLSSWAAAGFVVAAPRFPLSSAVTPGGVDASDVINQPGDMSFVITSVLATSAKPGGPLSGMINPKEVGVAGHSGGAITTLGLMANTCCRDSRVKAAVIMAGATEPYPGGHYDLAQAPPLLLVHGTADQLLPYNGAVAMFNSARAPKGLLSIEGGSHGSAAGGSSSSALAVQRATTDFFKAYLLGDPYALVDLSAAGQSGVTSLHLDARAGLTQTITTHPPPNLHLRASATPTTELTNDATVTVRWSGFTADKAVNILECNASDTKLNISATCNFAHAKLLTFDAAGQGSQSLEIVEGRVGNGTCDAAHPSCFIVVNNTSSLAPGATSVKIPIRFATERSQTRVVLWSVLNAIMLHHLPGLARKPPLPPAPGEQRASKTL